MGSSGLRVQDLKNVLSYKENLRFCDGILGSKKMLLHYYIWEFEKVLDLQGIFKGKGCDFGLFGVKNNCLKIQFLL